MFKMEILTQRDNHRKTKMLQLIKADFWKNEC